MKLNNKIKHLGVVLLTVTMAIGCASQQKQETAPAAAGPSASSVAIANAKASVTSLYRGTSFNSKIPVTILCTWYLEALPWPTTAFFIRVAAYSTKGAFA